MRYYELADQDSCPTATPNADEFRDLLEPMWPREGALVVEIRRAQQNLLRKTPSPSLDRRSPRRQR